MKALGWPADGITRRFGGRITTCSQIAHGVDRVLRRFSPELLAHRTWGYPGHPHRYPWCDNRLTFSILFPGPIFDQFVDELHRVAPCLERLATMQRCESESCEVQGIDDNGRPIAPRYGRCYTLIFKRTIRVYDDAGQWMLA